MVVLGEFKNWKSLTGEVCERLSRKWVCCEIVEEYIEGAKGRFVSEQKVDETSNDPGHYKIYSSAALWQIDDVECEEKLPEDGGRKRPAKRKGSEPIETKSLPRKSSQMNLFQNESDKK